MKGMAFKLNALFKNQFKCFSTRFDPTSINLPKNFSLLDYANLKG